MTEGPYKLPEGWRWVRLGEVCEVLMGQSPQALPITMTGWGYLFFKGRPILANCIPPRVFGARNR